MIEKKKGRRGGRKERKNKNNINHNHKNVPPRERQPGLSLKEVVTSKPNQPTILAVNIKKKKEDEDEDEDEDEIHGLPLTTVGANVYSSFLPFVSSKKKRKYQKSPQQQHVGLRKLLIPRLLLRLPRSLPSTTLLHTRN